ncbi:Uncharacterised protein [Pasteurella multocida]|nr:Uncharacterised protein [Pasteurella multocida]
MFHLFISDFAIVIVALGGLFLACLAIGDFL